MVTAQINVQIEDLNAVKSLLEKYLGVENIENDSSFIYGLNISVLDCSSEVDYTIDFMHKNNIIEKGPLDEYYNYEKSKIVVFIMTSKFSLFTECLPQLAEGVASFISRKLNLECAIFIEEQPMCVFVEGEKVIELKNNYEFYYRTFKL